MILDWATSYKFFLLLTVVFHPQESIRKFAFYVSVTLFSFGLLKEHYYYLTDLVGIATKIKSNYFLITLVEELSMMVLAIYLLPKSWSKLVICLQYLVFSALNIHQYLGWYQGSVFYDSFLSTKDYIYWNKWGFEIILLMLWMKDEVFSAIRARWTVNNVIMVYVIGWIVYLAGNY